MGLGADAWPVASHLVLVAVLVALGVRVMRAFAQPGLLAEAERRGLSAAAALVCAALALERSWAIFARVMRSRGIDVLGLHPAPEVLAALVAGSLYGVGAVLLLAERGPRRARPRILLEIGAMVLLWCLTVAVLG
jgi:hypothetical protein